MTLIELKQLLLAEVHSEAAFAFINTRIILRTGISLNEWHRELDPGRMQEVLRELRAMGLLKEKNR
jgi:hypothetical protein